MDNVTVSEVYEASGHDPSTPIAKNRLAPQTGAGFILRHGQKLKIIDPEGRQVSNLVLFNKNDIREKLSSGKTLDFEGTIYITEGNYIWSNRSRRMARIIEDTNGRNDFLLAPCCPETFKIMYNDYSYHPSCLENLWRNLANFDIRPDDIPTAFNIFMNVLIDERGRISVEPPLSKPGDHLTVEAEMDLVVGITACSADPSNSNTFKPIEYEIMW